MDIGIRDLRNGLSRHLAFVREGYTVTITDHGTPVARIVPIGTPNRLEQLIAAGKVTPAKQSRQARPEPVMTQGMVSDLIEHQRR